MTKKLSYDFKLRWRERKHYTYVDLASAIGALFFLLAPLPENINFNPMMWVLSDVCAAILLIMVEFGRSDAWARFSSNFILLCIGIMMLWMLSDGVVLPPVLFVIYTIRAWRIYRADPRASKEEGSRALVSCMGAGMPAAVIGGLFGWGIPSQLIMVEGFFLLSACLHLYPIFEWLDQ